MDKMWSSWASLESLVVPCVTKELPGLPQPQDDDLPSPAKQQKMEDFSLPPEMRKAFAAESARLQAMQTNILPYQPASAVRQSPGQSPTEPENDRRMYVPSLIQSLTHRDIFAHFCAFGDLEWVCVKSGMDSLNYAIVIFSRSASMHMAIAANPHFIKGHRLFCRKAAEKSPGKAVRQTKSVRTAPEDHPVPKTLSAKPSEKQPKKQPGKSGIEQKKTLKATPSRLGDLKENLMVPKKSVVPRESNQPFVYAVAASKRNCPWKFSLARSSTSLEEKEALKEGLPSAAKRLLEARAQKGKNSFTKPIHFIKPTTPVKPKEFRNYPSSTPGSIPNSPRVPVSLPPSSPRKLIFVSSQEDRVSITKPAPVPLSTPNGNSVPFLPPPINLEFPKPMDLKIISDNSYFGPDFRYEHHCYTNVDAYQKTKLYIDLQPGEREKRKTIKEYIDEKYGF